MAQAPIVFNLPYVNFDETEIILLGKEMAKIEPFPANNKNQDLNEPIIDIETANSFASKHVQGK